MGLNFYGRSFARASGKVEDLLGHQHEGILRDGSARMEWQEQYREHVTTYMADGEEQEAWYPSTRSMQVTTVLNAVHCCTYQLCLLCRTMQYQHRTISPHCPDAVL